MPWPRMVNSGEPSPSSELVSDLLLRSRLRAGIGTVLMAVQMLFASCRRPSYCHRQGGRQQDGHTNEAFHRHNPKLG